MTNKIIKTFLLQKLDLYLIFFNEKLQRIQLVL